MLNLKEVSIERLIVHVLDCGKSEKDKDRTIFSDFSIELEEKSRLSDYLQELIINVSRDESSNPAVLSGEYEKDMSPLYEKIVFQEPEFIPTSKIMGERLHEMMKGDRRIAPGVLVFCIFNTPDVTGGPLLGLLKLDVTDIFVHDINEVGKGRWSVTLKAIPNALPTTRERLQKAALISKQENPGWEMWVVDRQVGKKDKEPAADFFRRFLGVEWKYTPEQLTRGGLGFIKTIAAKFSQSESPQKRDFADYAYHFMDTALRAKKINLDDFVENSRADDDLKQEIRMEIAKAKIPLIIELDPVIRERMIGKLMYHGDNGLVLSAPVDVYNGIVREREITKNRVAYKEITITTLQWDRVKA
jgi:hypothetical protein